LPVFTNRDACTDVVYVNGAVQLLINYCAERGKQKMNSVKLEIIKVLGGKGNL